MSRYFTHTQLRITVSIPVIFVVTIWLAVAQQTQAASLVNPPSAPPGGLTAGPITGSSDEQHKLGSLIIGPLGLGAPSDQLCLNTSALAATDPDPSGKCITDWNSISGILSGSHVQLHPPFVPNASFGPTGAALVQQTGYVRLRGNNVASFPVTDRMSVYDCAGGGCSGVYTALYADGVTLDNNAGYFAGTVGIEQNGNGTDGRLCLNGTAAAPGTGDGFYCISHWSDIITAAPNKLTLQSSAMAPVIETGHVALGQALNSGSFVIGDPTQLTSPPAGLTCGDGMCSLNETVGSCPLDCAPIIPLVGISASISAGPSYVVTLNLKTGANQLPAGSQVKVLVVRSDSPSSNFRPLDGATYSRGGSTSFEIVGLVTCNAGVVTGCTMTDSTVDSTNQLIAGKDYYYSAFQANLYPRFQTADPARSSITIPGGSPENPPDEPPPVIG